MPTEEHFGEHKRAAQVPPWGATSEPPSQKEARENNAGVFTTYQWYHKGLRTTPGQPQRNSTTNHFDAEISWRKRSHAQESIRTPASEFYSRHRVTPVSANRKHNPHPKLYWPNEPHKEYLIYDRLSNYTAPEHRKPYPGCPPLIKSYHGLPKWTTTTTNAYFVDPQKAREAILEKGAPRTAGVGGDARGIKKESTSDQGEAPGSQLEQRKTGQAQRFSSQFKRPPPTADPLMKTSYQASGFGAPGRPATNERPIDFSWRNIAY